MKNLNENYLKDANRFFALDEDDMEPGDPQLDGDIYRLMKENGIKDFFESALRVLAEAAPENYEILKGPVDSLTD